MEQIGQFIGVAGFFGTILMIIMGSMVLAVIPIWAIIDCLMRDEEDMTKFVGAALIFVTWSIGGFIYSLFITKSSILRMVTIVSTIVIGVGGFLSAGACLTGAAIHGKASYDKDIARRKELIASYKPELVSSSTAGEFFALSQNDGASGVFAYDLNGKVKNVKDLGGRKKMKYIAFGPEGGNSYAASEYELYRFAASTFQTSGPHFSESLESLDEIASPEGKRYRYNGLVLDRQNNRLVVCLHYAFYGTIFSYDLGTSKWTELKNGKQYLFNALAGSPDGKDLYGITVENKAIGKVTRMDSLGNIVTTMDLSTEVPVLQRKYKVQSTWSKGYVIVILDGTFRYSDKDKLAPIVAIEPHSGKVLAANVAAVKGLEESSK